MEARVVGCLHSARENRCRPWLRPCFTALTSAVRDGDVGKHTHPPKTTRGHARDHTLSRPRSSVITSVSLSWIEPPLASRLEWCSTTMIFPSILDLPHHTVGGLIQNARSALAQMGSLQKWAYWNLNNCNSWDTITDSNISHKPSAAHLRLCGEIILVSDWRHQGQTQDEPLEGVKSLHGVKPLHM